MKNDFNLEYMKCVHCKTTLYKGKHRNYVWCYKCGIKVCKKCVKTVFCKTHYSELSYSQKEQLKKYIKKKKRNAILIGVIGGLILVSIALFSGLLAGMLTNRENIDINYVSIIIFFLFCIVFTLIGIKLIFKFSMSSFSTYRINIENIIGYSPKYPIRGIYSAP